jgi:hypothetical protein
MLSRQAHTADSVLFLVVPFHAKGHQLQAHMKLLYMRYRELRGAVFE